MIWSCASVFFYLNLQSLLLFWPCRPITGTWCFHCASIWYLSLNCLLISHFLFVKSWEIRWKSGWIAHKWKINRLWESTCVLSQKLKIVALVLRLNGIIFGCSENFTEAFLLLDFIPEGWNTKISDFHLREIFP